MPSLIDAYLRVDRAKEHLQEVHKIVQDFCETESIATRTKILPGADLINGLSSQVLSVETAFTPIDNRIKLLIGDFINSSRSCLDYIVSELSELDSGIRKRNTQFPITDSHENFIIARDKQLNGVNDMHASYIETLQPYHEVSWTKNIQKMSNQDKHTKLVMVTHDHLISGEVFVKSPNETLTIIYIQPSLRIELENGLQLLETLDNIFEGINVTLKHFSNEFDIK